MENIKCEIVLGKNGEISFYSPDPMIAKIMAKSLDHKLEDKF